MASDLRVPLDPLLEEFGVPATVTRPAPYDTPIETTGMWVSPEMVELPPATDLQRREQLRVLALPRSDVSTMPRGTKVAAAESADGPMRYWRVDEVVESDPDLVTVRLIADPDLEFE